MSHCKYQNLIFEGEDVELVGLVKPQPPHPNQYRQIARWYKKHSQICLWLQGRKMAGKKKHEAFAIEN